MEQFESSKLYREMLGRGSDFGGGKGLAPTVSRCEVGYRGRAHLFGSRAGVFARVCFSP